MRQEIPLFTGALTIVLTSVCLLANVTIAEAYSTVIVCNRTDNAVNVAMAWDLGGFFGVNAIETEGWYAISAGDCTPVGTARGAWYYAETNDSEKKRGYWTGSPNDPQTIKLCIDPRGTKFEIDDADAAKCHKPYKIVPFAFIQIYNQDGFSRIDLTD